VCVARPATALLEIDGRRYPACCCCVRERVPEPPEPEGLRTKALRALRRFDGEASVEELALALGLDDEVSRGTLSASLKRAILAGEVFATGTRMTRRYSVAPTWRPPISQSA
jgi:DNA-binding transcriptional ArsR family regulator